MIIINKKSIHSVVKVNGVIVDDQFLPNGINDHYNERVLEIIGEIDVNGNIYSSEIPEGKELYFNFETEKFYLQ